jgi:cell division protein FtsN
VSPLPNLFQGSFLNSHYNQNKAMQLTPRQRNAVSAMKMAQSRTKKQLKSQEQLKTIVTYPKGLYKKTLEKNLDRAMEEVGLPNRNSKTGSKPKGKPAAKRKAAMSGGSATKRKDGMSAVSATKRKDCTPAVSSKAKRPTATKRKSTPKPKGLIASIKKMFS